MDLAELGIVYISEGADAAISKMEEYKGVVIDATLSTEDQVKADAKLVSAKESLSAQINRSIVSYKGAQSAQYEFAAIAMGVHEQLYKQIEALKTLEEMEHEATQAFKETADAAKLEQGAMLDLAKDIEYLNKVKAKEAQEADAARKKELADRQKYYDDIVAKAKASEQAIIDAKHKAIIDAQDTTAKAAAMYIKDEQERVKSAERAAKEVAAINKKTTDNAQKEAERQAMSEISWAEKSRDEQLRIKSQIAAYRGAGVSDSTIASKFGNASLNGAVKEVESFAESWDKVSLNTSRVRSEIIVVAHEMIQGRFSRVPASMMVFAEYSDLSAVAMSAVGVAIMTVVAAGALLSIEMIKGVLEQKEMADALIMTGNYAGTTAGGLNNIAHSAAIMGGSVSVAKGLVIELANSGKYTADQISTITSAVTLMQHATGMSDDAVASLVKEFESLSVQMTNHKGDSSAISEATLKLNDHYHFLTEAVFLQIEALEREGKQKEASKLATDTLAEATKTRAEEMIHDLGFVERAWNGVKHAIDTAKDSVLNWGKHETAQDRVDAAAKNVRYYAENKPLIGEGSTQWIVEKKIALDMLMFAQAELNKETEAGAKASEKQQIIEAAAHASAQQTAIDKVLLKKSQGELNVALTEYHERLDKWRKDAEVNGTVNPELDPAKIAETTKNIIREHSAHTTAAKGVKIHLDAYTLFLEEMAKYALATDQMQSNEAKQTEVQKFQINELYKLVDAYKKGKMSIDELRNAEVLLQTNVDSRKAVTQLIEDKKRLLAIEQDELKAADDTIKANDKIEASYLAAAEAAKEYLATFTLQSQRKVDGIGQGSQERSEASGLNSIEDKFQKERNKILKDRNKDGEYWYQKRLDFATESYAKEVDVYLQTLQQMKDARANWYNGASEAIKNYSDKVDDTSKSIDTIFTNSFKSMEDSLTTFFTTGKLGWGDLENIIVSGITRIIVQQQMIEPMAKYLQGGMSSGGGIGGIIGSIATSIFGGGADPAGGANMTNLFADAIPRANGGPVGQNGLYQVAENGPELLNVGGRQFLMMGNQNGSVTPNNQIGSSGQSNNTVVNNHFTISGPVDRRTQAQIGAAAASGAQRAISRNY